MRIRLLVLTEFTNVTARRTDGHRMTAYKPRLGIASSGINEHLLSKNRINQSNNRIRIVCFVLSSNFSMYRCSFCVVASPPPTFYQDVDNDHNDTQTVFSLLLLMNRYINTPQRTPNSKTSSSAVAEMPCDACFVSLKFFVKSFEVVQGHSELHRRVGRV